MTFRPESHELTSSRPCWAVLSSVYTPFVSLFRSQSHFICHLVHCITNEKCSPSDKPVYIEPKRVEHRGRVESVSGAVSAAGRGWEQPLALAAVCLSKAESIQNKLSFTFYRVHLACCRLHWSLSNVPMTLAKSTEDPLLLKHQDKVSNILLVWLTFLYEVLMKPEKCRALHT